MRFFTFLITACAVIISTNAENTAKRDSENAIISNDACSTLLEKTIRTLANSAKVLNDFNFDTTDDGTKLYIIGIIETQYTDITLGLKDVPSTCCGSLDPGSTHIKTSLDSTSTLINIYVDLLSNFKSKKASIEKNPKVMESVKTFFLESNPKFSDLINCVRTYREPRIQLTAKNLLNSYSDAWDKFKNSYGI